MNKHVQAILLLIVSTLLLCCVAYPLVLLAVGWTVFPDKVEGSLIRGKGPDGQEFVRGSRQIAQPFTNDAYFWPRPSSASYNAAAAGGSNWGANNPKLRDRIAQQLGTIIRFKKTGPFFTGSEPEKAVQRDIQTWFTVNPDRVATWANEYSVGATNWAKTDLVKDTYGLQGEFILAWAQQHPEIIDDWKKVNPGKTDEPKPEELAGMFFASFAKKHPGRWPGVVEARDGVKRIEPVESDDTIPALFFDMWLQDPKNAAKVADLDPVPSDMVTASGAGLDPHITVHNATSVYQLDRVVKARADKTKRSPSLVRAKVEAILHAHSFTPLSGLVGEPLVNVLEVNLELDKQIPLSPE